MLSDITALTKIIAERLLARNAISRVFFGREASRLAAASEAMAGRFLAGGRLLAFGRGPYTTDAQHVSVEFVHPVIVGKRALPALDVSALVPGGVRAMLRPEDMVMGFGPPGGDPGVAALLGTARTEGAYTLALPGAEGDYAVAAPSEDAFIHQELLEILYHTLWETIHVFFEHRERGHEVGASAFLYPFLGTAPQDTGAALDEVAASILAKAEADERLRESLARDAAGTLAQAVCGLRACLAEGGTLLCFGNGGSATDANDFAFDCLQPPAGYRPVPALSLAQEPATLSALANDIGPEATFLRQLIALARPEDAVVAFSTSGNSASIVAALTEARKRNLFTVAFLGYDGGEVARRGLAEVALVVPCDYIPRIQEIHASLYHVLREVLEPMPYA